MPKCKHIVDNFILQFLDYTGIGGLANDIAKTRHLDCFTHYATKSMDTHFSDNDVSHLSFVTSAVRNNWVEALKVPDVDHGNPVYLLVTAYNHGSLECYFALTQMYPSVFFIHSTWLESYKKCHMAKRSVMIRHAIEHAPPSIRGDCRLFFTFHRCTRGLDVELFKLLKSKFDVGSLGHMTDVTYANTWTPLNTPVRRYRFDTEPEGRVEFFKYTTREPHVYHDGELEVIVRGQRKYEKQIRFVKALRAQFALLYEQRKSHDTEWSKVFTFYYFDPLSISSLVEWI